MAQRGERLASQGATSAGAIGTGRRAHKPNEHQGQEQGERDRRVAM